MSGLTFTLADGIAEIALDDGKVNALSEQMIERCWIACSRPPTLIVQC